MNFRRAVKAVSLAEEAGLVNEQARDEAQRALAQESDDDATSECESGTRKERRMLQA